MKPNNFHNLLTVIKFTMRDLLSRKSFRISTIIIVILIVLGFNIPNFLDGFSDNLASNTILVVDRDNVYDGKIPDIENLQLSTDSNDVIEEKIMNDEVSAAIFI